MWVFCRVYLVKRAGYCTFHGNSAGFWPPQGFACPEQEGNLVSSPSSEQVNLCGNVGHRVLACALKYIIWLLIKQKHSKRPETNQSITAKFCLIISQVTPSVRDSDTKPIGPMVLQETQELQLHPSLYVLDINSTLHLYECILYLKSKFEKAGL